ncbi:MAG: ABC transporter ATP-binding protein [Gammaproteobacteria bacterium]|nr:ABC transporter ATP-binding protein [Gammaproteobacteria bacterium]
MSSPDSPGMTTGEVLKLIGRSLRLAWPFRLQIVVKLVLALIGATVVLMLPWPLKMLTDHVVMKMPVGTSPTPYPPYVQPLLDLVADMSPLGMVWCFLALAVVGIVLIGAFGTDAATSDSAEGNVAEGFDTATRSENQANVSNSRVGGLLGLFEYHYQLRITHRINHQLRALLYQHLLCLPITRFSDLSIGDAIYRVMYDTPSISRLCYDLLVTPVVAIYSVGVIIWTTHYSYSAVPSLIATAWLAAPIVLLSTILGTHLARRRSLVSRQAGATTTANVEEGMSNIAAVQSLGASASQRAAFANASAESFRGFRRFEVLNAIVVGFQGVVVAGLAFVVFYDVANVIIDKRMSAGDYAVLYAFFLQIAAITAGLGALWFLLQNNIAGMKRVWDIVDLSIDAEQHDARTLPAPASHVRLDGVSYTYPDGTIAVDNVSLDGRVGEMIALVGATGAGKTTLAYMLPGFISPTSGRVLIDDIDARELQVDALRANVSFVFQEAFAFDDTVANNIRMGHSAASEQDVERAARTARAFDFISALPDGFATRLGRAAATLSGGQKQRLAIARGLVSPAPILVLDEPTAALDPETENALMEALQAERQKRLLVIIAHRLSTIRTADRIVFIDRGRIVETGSHNELMANPNGAYRRFVDLHTGAVNS